MAKATTTAKADKTKDQAPEMAPEETKETKAPEETEGGTQKEEKAKATTTTTTTTAKAEKVYKFTSKNKYLTCSAVGVQFIDGKAETKSLEVAKVLATLDGVTLIEE